MLESAKGYAIKLVNPGGVEVWKSGGANISEIDQDIGHFNCTPRQIIQGLAQTAMDIGLPHAVHIHCNNLGIPGNWRTTQATMDALKAVGPTSPIFNFIAMVVNPMTKVSSVPRCKNLRSL